MKLHQLSVFLALPLGAQIFIPPGTVQATISLQPRQVFIAAEGATLTKVAMYSMAVCNSSNSAETKSEGLLRQAAETQAHLNVVDSVLVPATSARAAKKSKLGKFMSGLKWAGFAAAVVLAAKLPTKPIWSEGATAIAAGVQLGQSALAPDQTAAQATAAAAQASMIDPSRIMALAPGTCATRILLAEYVAGFKPVPLTF